VLGWEYDDLIFKPEKLMSLICLLLQFLSPVLGIVGTALLFFNSYSLEPSEGGVLIVKL
jgi:hypothetical protein